jgi:hypothetical protein
VTTKKQPLPKIEIRTNEFVLECDGLEFNVSDRRDQDNWPVLIPPQRRTKTAVKAFYSWIVAHIDMIQTPGYRFGELHHDLNKDGIACHYYCSMD